MPLQLFEYIIKLINFTVIFTKNGFSRDKLNTDCRNEMLISFSDFNVPLKQWFQADFKSECVRYKEKELSYINIFILSDYVAV